MNALLKLLALLLLVGCATPKTGDNNNSGGIGGIFEDDNGRSLEIFTHSYQLTFQQDDGTEVVERGTVIPIQRSEGGYIRAFSLQPLNSSSASQVMTFDVTSGDSYIIMLERPPYRFGDPLRLPDGTSIVWITENENKR